MLKNQEQSEQLQDEEIEAIAPIYDILQSVRKVMAISGSIGLMMLTGVGAATLRPNSASSATFDTKCETLCNPSYSHSAPRDRAMKPSQSDPRYVVTLVNHSNAVIGYSFKEVGVDKSGDVGPGQRARVDLGVRSDPLNFGDVKLLVLPLVRPLGFRFWYTTHLNTRVQNINLLAREGWEVKRDNEEINEAVTDGFRVTVDSGGHRQEVENIHIQIYNE